jgi:hypothetical protein
MSPGLGKVIVAATAAAAEFVAEELAAPELDDELPLELPHAARPMEQATATARAVETLGIDRCTAVSSGRNIRR